MAMCLPKNEVGARRRSSSGLCAKQHIAEKIKIERQSLARGLQPSGIQNEQRRPIRGAISSFVFLQKSLHRKISGIAEIASNLKIDKGYFSDATCNPSVVARRVEGNRPVIGCAVVMLVRMCCAVVRPVFPTKVPTVLEIAGRPARKSLKNWLLR
jgi:hypothetical protein